MYETIISMFDNIMTLMKQKTVKSARKVFKKDKILDKINANSFTIIEEEIKKDIQYHNRSTASFSVVKKFERIGDLIKNIAEEIIFYIDAEVIKTSKRKNKFYNFKMSA